VNSIPYGEDFPEFIQTKLREYSVCLAVIGPRWLDSANSSGQRRLDDPNDFVRIEIETALRLGLVVIPVLVYGAKTPPTEALPETLAKLQHLNAAQVRLDPDFTADVQRLSEVVDRFVPPLSSRTSRTPAPTAAIRRVFGNPKLRRRLVVGLIAAVLLSGLAGGALKRNAAIIDTVRASFVDELVTFDVPSYYALLCPDVQARIPESRMQADMDTYTASYGVADISHMTFTLVDESLTTAHVRFGGSYTLNYQGQGITFHLHDTQQQTNVGTVYASGLGWCLWQDFVLPSLLT
jgi:hypothetical protein